MVRGRKSVGKSSPCRVEATSLWLEKTLYKSIFLKKLEVVESGLIAFTPIEVSFEFHDLGRILCCQGL